MTNYYVDFIQKTNNDLCDDNEVIIVKNIIENMNKIFSMNIETLAELSFSSPTTIIRFVKRLGFESYTDFRKKISISFQELVDPEPVKRYSISKKFTRNDLEKLYEVKINTLSATYNKIDFDYLNNLTIKLVNASSVIIIGDYYSQEVFYLLQITLNMYNIPCFIFKQDKIKKEYLNMIEDNAVILCVGRAFSKILENSINTNVEKIILSMNNFEDLVVCDNKSDTFLSLQYLGEIIVYMISNTLMEVDNGK